jgi:sodium/potassium-transporting ATPase subunit alpha
MATEYDADEHGLTIDELAARLETQLDAAAPRESSGLTAAAAAARLAVEGPNLLSPPKETPEILKVRTRGVDACMRSWGPRSERA